MGEFERGLEAAAKLVETLGTTEIADGAKLLTYKLNDVHRDRMRAIAALVRALARAETAKVCATCGGERRLLFGNSVWPCTVCGGTGRADVEPACTEPRCTCGGR